MKKKKEIDIVPMKCPACTDCYREADRLTDRCHFGGPYTGYTIVKENAPIA